jgi:hypothetical protein
MSATEWGPWGPHAPANIIGYDLRAVSPLSADVTFTAYLDGNAMASVVFPAGETFKYMYLGFVMNRSQVLVLGVDGHEGTEITARLVGQSAGWRG